MATLLFIAADTRAAEQHRGRIRRASHLDKDCHAQAPPDRSGGFSVSGGLQPPPPAVPKNADELAREQFVRLAVQAVYPVGREANPGWSQASLAVHYSIDRENQIVDCKAGPVSAPKSSGGLPFSPKVAERMNHLCWQTVLPPMPTQLMDEGPTTQLIAPLLFPELAEDAQGYSRETAFYSMPKVSECSP